MPTNSELFERLQTNIVNHAWMECQDDVELLIAQLTPRDAIQLAVVNLTPCVPIFERYRPKIDWPRHALALMAEGDPLPPEFQFSPEVEGVNPMVNDFLDALDELDTATQEIRPQIAVLRCRKAIYGAFNTRRYDKFSQLFPKDWVLYLKHEAGEEGLPPLRSEFLDEPQIQAFTESLWRDLTAQLQRRLGSKP